MIRFHFSDLSTPTLHQLRHYLLKNHALELSGTEQADLVTSHLDYPELQALEFKHLLYASLSPDLLWLQPLTYYIDDFCWLEVCSQIREKGWTHPWILKPSMLNNGQSIKIFSSVDEIPQHFLNPSRLAGPHVLQAYLSQPHLLKGPEKGHKYSIRMFMIMTEEVAYLYPHGYFNIALKPYDEENFNNLRAHLTNEHLEHDVYNVVQVPTFQYALFAFFWPAIKNMSALVAYQFLGRQPIGKNPKLGFLGVDFMVDADERVWLLEINHGPCFPQDSNHPLYEKLYQPFWQSVVKEIVLPKFGGGSQQLTEFILISHA